MSTSVCCSRWIINWDWYFLAGLLGNVIVCVLTTARGETCSCQSGRLAVKQWEVCATESKWRVVDERGGQRRTRWRFIHVVDMMLLMASVRHPSIATHSCKFRPYKSAVSFVGQWKQSMLSYCHSPPLSPLNHFLRNRMLWIGLQRCVKRRDGFFGLPWNLFLFNTTADTQTLRAFKCALQ